MLLDKIKNMEKPERRTWHYEKPGDCIAGIIVSMEMVSTKHGERRAIEVLSELDGVLTTVWAGTVIENEVTRQRAEVGDGFAAKFLGRVNNYNAFIVIIEKKKTDGKPEDASKKDDIPF